MQQYLSKLKISQKLVVLLGVFFVPLGILGYLNLSSLREQMEFERNQLVGLRLLGPTLAVSEKRPWAQDTIHLTGKTIDSIEKVLIAFNEADADLTRWALEVNSQKLSAKSIPDLLEKLMRESKEEERDRIRDQLDSLTLELIKGIALQSGLLLDPEYSTYNLIFTSGWVAPSTFITIRELIHRVDGSDIILSSNKAEMVSQAKGLIKSLLPDQIYSGINHAINFEKGTSKKLLLLQKQLEDFRGAADHLINQLTQSTITNWNSEQIIGAATAMENTLTALTGELFKVIEEHLIERQRAHNLLYWSGMGLEVGTILILLWLSTAISKNINQQIYSLLAALRVAATNGDLSVQVEVKGKDELAIMSHAFNQMILAIRQVVSEVKASSRSVGGSAEEIAATSRQQQATANEVAATVVQIEATSKEISATSQQLAKTVTDVHTVAESTAQAAVSSQNGLVKMEETMGRIVDECSSIASRLSTLSERATRIGSIVTTISKVADQTNLLSLNAAIEAEKAGDAGRGFTVVATEIRRMADQTAISSFDIEQTVKEMQSAVSSSVMGMERFSDEVKRGVTEVKTVISELTSIIGQVRDLTPRFESVQDGMGSQALGAQQISEAITQLSVAAQQSVQAITQSVKCVERLRDASTNLICGVERFSGEEAHDSAA